MNETINENNSLELEEDRLRLLGSLSLFTQAFYSLRTGRDFEISKPDGRESHHIQIFRALTRVIRGECKRLIINVPPRYGKTEIVINFIAWCLALYKDANFLYVSYSSTLATRQTQTIREIMMLPAYRKIFNIRLKEGSEAKGDFATEFGGTVYACGAGGTIVGMGAGIKNCNRFGGAIIIDDIHKPDEASSDTMREGVKDWYHNTLQSRLNSADTPIIFIGQRVHEDDLAAYLISHGGWEVLSLPALDENENALYPSFQDKETLLKMAHQSLYHFSAQYQQSPVPAGGALFKQDDFIFFDEEPKFLQTFITCDTAETSKQYNDATVFSFWGLYKVSGIDNTFALHWIDCLEIRVEPRDLESEFMSFYTSCCRHKTRPTFVAIERKSTGVTLSSVLSKIQGMKVREITRTAASGSKSDRFISMQSFISEKLISFTRYSSHAKMCIEHMSKITANDSHRHDDIADTCYDAIKIALIDKSIIYSLASQEETKIETVMRQDFMNRLDAIKSRYN